MTRSFKTQQVNVPKLFGEAFWEFAPGKSYLYRSELGVRQEICNLRDSSGMEMLMPVLNRLRNIFRVAMSF